METVHFYPQFHFVGFVCIADEVNIVYRKIMCVFMYTYTCTYYTHIYIYICIHTYVQQKASLLCAGIAHCTVEGTEA